METKWTEVRDILSTFPIFVGQILWVGWKVENTLGPGVLKRNTHRLIYFSCYSLHSFHSTFLMCLCERFFASYSLISFAILCLLLVQNDLMRFFIFLTCLHVSIYTSIYQLIPPPTWASTLDTMEQNENSEK